MQRDTILAVWGSHQKTEQFSRSNNDSVCSELISSFNIHYLPSHNPAMRLWGWWWRRLFCILDTILLCATGWFWPWTPPALASGMLGLQVCTTIADYNVLCFLSIFMCVYVLCKNVYMHVLYVYGCTVWGFICTCVQMLVLLVSPALRILYILFWVAITGECFVYPEFTWVLEDLNSIHHACVASPSTPEPSLQSSVLIVVLLR